MGTRLLYLILIVSSQSDRLSVRHRVIRQAGYHALPTPSVAHAVALAHKARPSVVLTDIALDDGRALSLVRALRGHEALRQVPVILLGIPLPDEEEHLTQDPHTHVYHDANEATLLTLVDNLLVA
jgi:CheY-like chemotaxis protein